MSKFSETVQRTFEPSQSGARKQQNFVIVPGNRFHFYLEANLNLLLTFHKKYLESIIDLSNFLKLTEI